MKADSSIYVFGSDHSDLGTWSHVMYIIFAVIALILLICQLLYLRRLKVISVYLLLPILSMCVMYENISLYLSSAHKIADEIVHMYIGYILQSITVPLFLIVLYEVIFRLHEFRNVHFFCFELEVSSDSLGAKILLWLMRIIFVGLILMQLIVEFEWFDVNNQQPIGAGSAGYAYLIDNPGSVALWLSLFPSICLSFFGILVSHYVFKYGSYVALDNNTLWKLMSFTIIFQIIGQCFYSDLYPVTSNGGELLLLVGLTIIVFLAQYELSQAASYADFLHRSNRAFKAISLAKSDIDAITTVMIENASSNKAYKRGSGTFVAEYVRNHRISIDGKPPNLADIEAGGGGEEEGSGSDTEDEERVSDLGADIASQGGIELEVQSPPNPSLKEQTQHILESSDDEANTKKVTIDLSEF